MLTLISSGVKFFDSLALMISAMDIFSFELEVALNPWKNMIVSEKQFST